MGNRRAHRRMHNAYFPLFVSAYALNGRDRQQRHRSRIVPAYIRPPMSHSRIHDRKEERKKGDDQRSFEWKYHVNVKIELQLTVIKLICSHRFLNCVLFSQFRSFRCSSLLRLLLIKFKMAIHPTHGTTDDKNVIWTVQYDDCTLFTRLGQGAINTTLTSGTSGNGHSLAMWP